MFKRLWDRLVRRVYEHRARWTARRIAPFLRPGDRVLDVGAGDCRLDLILTAKCRCAVVPLDVDDYNTTSLPLTLYDGCHVPFPDDSFDVVLLIFVLHHATDARAVLLEAQRVCRRHVIVFEDVNQTVWDRWVFRVFHRWLAWSQKIPRPHREWDPERWSALARDLGFGERARTLLGRQLGYFASRHIAFVWQKSAGSDAACRRAA